MSRIHAVLNGPDSSNNLLLKTRGEECVSGGKKATISSSRHLKLYSINDNTVFSVRTQPLIRIIAYIHITHCVIILLCYIIVLIYKRTVKKKNPPLAFKTRINRLNNNNNKNTLPDIRFIEN